MCKFIWNIPEILVWEENLRAVENFENTCCSTILESLLLKQKFLSENCYYVSELDWRLLKSRYMTLVTEITLYWVIKSAVYQEYWYKYLKSTGLFSHHCFSSPDL
jgi:hypothetical protein